MKKKIIVVFLTIICCFFIQYISMHSFKDSNSAFDLKTWLSERAIYFSLIITMILSVTFYLSAKVNHKISFCIDFIITVFLLFFANYLLFNEFESSWSTYLFQEELVYVGYFSFIPIFIGALTLIILKNRILKR